MAGKQARDMTDAELAERLNMLRDEIDTDAPERRAVLAEAAARLGTPDVVGALVSLEQCVQCGGKLRDYVCRDCGESYEEHRDA